MHPRILNIHEAWQLNNIIGNALGSYSALDIIDTIAKKSSKESIFRAVEILYGDDYKISGTIADMLMLGIRTNQMTKFHSFMGRLSKNRGK